MNKKVFVVVVGVAMACVMASGLIASNMGFKLNYPLVAVGAGSNSGTNVVAAPIDYIVVGSHEPSLSISLDGPGAGSNSGTNFFSAPYHTTSTTALDLMNDIGFASVQNIQRFLEATDGLETYTGRKGTPAPNFNLVPGEAYFIRMGSTVSYTPSHF